MNIEILGEIYERAFPGIRDRMHKLQTQLEQFISKNDEEYEDKLGYMIERSAILLGMMTNLGFSENQVGEYCNVLEETARDIIKIMKL